MFKPELSFIKNEILLKNSTKKMKALLLNVCCPSRRMPSNLQQKLLELKMCFPTVLNGNYI
jgi:hypothetical protein